MNAAGAVRRAESRRFLIFSVLSLESSFPGEHGVYIHIGWIKRIARYAAIAPEGASLLGLGGVCSVISGRGTSDKDMLFNSYSFIFVFLPIALAGFFLLARIGNFAAVIWLTLASLAFFASSNWQFVSLLLGSIAFNCFIGLALITSKLGPRARRAALTIGVSGDLLVLGFFKYAGFFAANLNAVFSTGLTLNILLPVGISFYTFTQIAFLVDAYRKNVASYALPHYALFVTYFPHLIAGPILHHKDMIPQFENAAGKRANPHLILCGLIFFAIGLFKKTCLADGVQPLVALAFGPTAPSFDQAWLGALAYTFQLY